MRLLLFSKAIALTFHIKISNSKRTKSANERVFCERVRPCYPKPHLLSIYLESRF